MSEVYDKKIKPLVEEINEICISEKIPYFATFVISDKEGKTEYETYRLTPGVAEVKINDDRITKMLNVANGFDTIPPHKMLELEF